MNVAYLCAVYNDPELTGEIKTEMDLHLSLLAFSIKSDKMKDLQRR